MVPYVPSLKTDGKSQDRVLIDKEVDKVAQEMAEAAQTNFDVLEQYKAFFSCVCIGLIRREAGAKSAIPLVNTIWDVAEKYEYEGAFLGELNYAITRIIQRVPQIKVGLGEWEAKSELRYWLYAITVEASIYIAKMYQDRGIGIGGVFEDIKDEYKRRVNTAYEAACILKSGDCYDTPYYTKLVEVRDENDKLIGHQEIMVKRSDETKDKDVLEGSFVLKAKKAVQTVTSTTRS